MMGAAQIDRYGNQNISAIGDWRRPKAQLLGVRGAPGNTVNHPVSYWIPRHSPRVFTGHVDMVCGVGYDRGARELRVVVTNLAVLDFGDAGAGDAAAFGPSGRGDRRGAGGDRLPARRPGPGAGHPGAHGRRARADPRQARPDRGAGAGAAVIVTALTELLGIRYPVVQAAMGYVSGPRLAAATSNAGGLGLIASATMSLPELEQAIEETAGVPPRRSASTCAPTPPMRPNGSGSSSPPVPVASFAQAPKPELIAALKDAGVVTIASVGARRHAEKAAGWGIDAVIATGGEGGGHVGAVPTSLLIPQVAAAVDIPVIAAGGFFDGRGLVAALAWGAAGVAMGTRFLLTSDSPVADAVKQALPGGGPGRHGGHQAGRRGAAPGTTDDHGRPSGGAGGGRAASGPRQALVRSARNAAAFRGVSGMGWREMMRQGRAMRRDSELTWGQVLMAANTPVLLRAAMVDGRTDLGLMSSGQVAGLIGDLPSCAELIEGLMAEAGATLDRLDGMSKA